MSTTYDPQIIQEFADRLYKKAESIILASTILIGLCGGVIGVLFGEETVGAIGLVGGGIVGYVVGVEAAFKYRLQAHTALCQVKIEANTQ